jgi:cell division transport system permease protein
MQEGWLTLWRNKLVSILSIGTIAVSFTVLGLFLLLSVNLGAFAELYGDSFLLHVFLRDDATSAQTGAVEEAMRGEPEIAGVTFVSRDEAVARFRTLFPDESGMLASLERNSLPASFEVRLKDSIVQADAREALERLIARLNALPGVDRTLYDRQWVETLESSGRWIAFFGLIIGVMLMLAAVVTASNIIKLNIVTRQEEIEIMRLVGADGIFVKGPFIIGGVIQGLLASALALFVIYILHQLAIIFLDSVNIELLRGLELHFLPWPYQLAFVAGGLVVGALASLLSFGKMSRI